MSWCQGLRISACRGLDGSLSPRAVCAATQHGVHDTTWPQSPWQGGWQAVTSITHCSPNLSTSSECRGGWACRPCRNASAAHDLREGHHTRPRSMPAHHLDVCVNRYIRTVLECDCERGDGRFGAAVTVIPAHTHKDIGTHTDTTHTLRVPAPGIPLDAGYGYVGVSALVKAVDGHLMRVDALVVVHVNLPYRRQVHVTHTQTQTHKCLLVDLI